MHDIVSHGLRDVPTLVELFRSTGLPVVLQSAGVPPTDPGILLAIYRVIQEGLTNALKYARAESGWASAWSSTPRRGSKWLAKLPTAGW
jgi:signal transduction histidine kinase